VKTIVWDVDDVLNDLMRNWLEQQWLPRHPEHLVDYSDLTENPPHRVLGVSRGDYLDSLDEFRLTRMADLSPVPEVREWFEKRGHQFRHVALSAVPLLAAQISARWVFSYFGRWIRSFHFVPSPRQGDPPFHYDQSKSEFLRWLGLGDIMVDDNPANVAAGVDLGLVGVLFPRPWNTGSGSILHLLEQLSLQA
jgi:hypothetical protein